MLKKPIPQIFFVLLVLLISTAFFGLIGDFLLAVFWAIVFAILFYGTSQKIRNRYTLGPSIAAGITLAIIFLIVIVPLSVISLLVINQAATIYDRINESDTTLEEKVEDLQEKIPINNSLLRRLGFTATEIQTKISGLIASGTEMMAGKAVSVTQDIFGFLVNFFLMLYVLFFFLRDGKRLVQQLVWVIPIGDEHEWTLLHRFESVCRATVKGSLVVAIVQGTLGGVLFWALDIPGAFLWGAIMVIASLLPVGSALVWAPWGIILLFQGELVRGIVLLAVGAGFIGLIDNVLRPRLVGQDTKMPDYLILLATLGGLAWFGISGFVIGPVIAALFVTCWQMLGKEYGEPYQEVVTEPPAKQLNKD